MHALLFLVAVPLALANSGLSPRYAPLLPRQGGDAFVPGQTIVDSCDAPCGADECLDVPNGDTCCAEGYACPGGSFCLTQGYCCPNGDSPSDCAAGFGITLSAGFQASNTVPAGTAAASSGAAASSSAILVPASTTPTITAPAITAPTSTAPTFTGHAKNATGSAPHATGTGAAPGGIVTFTGGADVVHVGDIGAVIGGIVGFMLL